jgi:CIC family chloride channel protein
VAALVAGALTGVLGAAFRYSLGAGEVARTALLDWSHRFPALGWVIPVLAAAAAAGLARALVRLAPLAAGSGVQHVEALARGQSTPAPARTIPVKFVGGLLAIGAGLALGREGPTVQMGAVVGNEVGRRLRVRAEDRVALLLASAGAGLAVAFNAPFGGATFVFEEVAHRFRVRLGVVALLACAAAVAVSRGILGDHPVFEMAPPAPTSIVSLVPFVLFGALLGTLGVAYNKAVVASLDLLGRLRSVPVEARAALVGGGVGLLGWFGPSLVGGGDGMNQRILDGGVPLGTLALLLGVRWILGPISYAPGTPGGLFAPLLLVGAAAGALFHGLLEVLPFGALPPVLAHDLLPSAPTMAAVGMAAFFAAVVRAPLTGILLVTEMIASTALTVPLLAACAAAVLAATLLRNPPIYDTLRMRMLEAASRPPTPEDPRHVEGVRAGER